VYHHWGGRMEGTKLPDRELIPIAYKIIDAGADLIIGHHSHTIQHYEIYKGKYIFYSLGNFCFSDLISDGRISYLYRRRGLKGAIVSVVFTTQNYHYIQPFIISLADNKITLLYKTLKYTKIDKYLVKNRLWRFYTYYEKKIYPIYRFLFHSGQPIVNQVCKIKLSKINKHLRMRV
jgi:poly-gamma-glutamate synthesis protein (capsule biosynthesis protein)